MTRKQKEVLVAAVMDHVGELLEFWDEKIESYNPELAEIDKEEARKVITSWMSKLPGTAWNNSFGPPNR